MLGYISVSVGFLASVKHGIMIVHKSLESKVWSGLAEMQKMSFVEQATISCVLPG